MMPKGPVPTSALVPRPKQRTTLILPFATSISCNTLTSNGICAHALFSAPTIQKASILDYCIDASTYSYAQLLWFQSNELQRLKVCFDRDIFHIEEWATYVFTRSRSTNYIHKARVATDNFIPSRSINYIHIVWTI